MKHLFKLITAVLLLIIVTACTANSSDNATSVDAEIQGPALVVFYTDN